MAYSEQDLTPPTFLTELSRTIRGYSETDNFLITGGNVIDPFIGGQENLGDVDVAFNASKTDELVRILSSKGFVFTEFLPYQVERDKHVVVTTATKDGMTLDIVFADDPNTTVGPINALGLYYDPVRDVVVDRHGCLDAHARGTFNCLPEKDFDHENAYVIGARTVIACAKYGASVVDQQPTILDEFNERKGLEEDVDDFAYYARISFPSEVIKAIAKARPQDRARMTEEVVATEVLVNSCDRTNRGLERILGSVTSQLILCELETAESIKQLVLRQAA